MHFNYRHCRNEAEVRSKLIVYYLLPRLGYSPESWYEEVTYKSIRLDFLVVNQAAVFQNTKTNLSQCFIIETKHPQENLDNHVFQFNNYLQLIPVKHGMLTNGREIRIYQRIQSSKLAQGLFPNSPKLLFQCHGDEIESNLEKIKTLLSGDKFKDHSRNTQHNKLVINNTSAAEQTKAKPKMKTIAVYHNKGGVGKTTTVVNLAAALSKSGKKVLVIDLDSQANTTFATGLIKFESEFDDYIKDANVYHVIGHTELYPISEIKVISQFCNPPIDIIPSHISLMEKEDRLNRLASINFTLIQKLKEVEYQYDIVLIDTPPSLNLYAKIALITADYLLIPSDLKPFANQGLINVKNFITDINATKKVINKEPLKIVGVLPCKITTHHRFVQHTLPIQQSKITDKYDLPLLDTVIFQREALAQCSDLVQIVGELEIPDPRSVLDFRPGSPSAQEFKNLATEILTKTK